MERMAMSSAVLRLRVRFEVVGSVAGKGKGEKNIERGRAARI